MSHDDDAPYIDTKALKRVLLVKDSKTLKGLLEGPDPLPCVRLGPHKTIFDRAAVAEWLRRRSNVQPTPRP